MPVADELLQIVVRGVDRHAAHGDVLALVLAALGERDAEGAGGRFGILEEQLVEVAHAIEQQAAGLAALISRNCAIIGVARSVPLVRQPCRAFRSRPVRPRAWRSLNPSCPLLETRRSGYALVPPPRLIIQHIRS